MQNDLIKINQKKPRIIIILITFFFFLIVTFLLWWFFFRQNSNSLQPFSNSSPTEETSLINNSQKETAPELVLAQKILHQISNHQSQEGFYGDWQICLKEKDKQNYTCELNMYPYEMKEGLEEFYDETASYRYSIPVIWARFKYYQKTNDQEQLKLLEKDLYNLDNYLSENNERLLNTDVYNCSLMEEITNSDLISDEIKNLTTKICFIAVAEVSPKSDINYTNHAPYRFINGINENDPSGVITDGQKYNTTDLKNFNLDDLTTKINNNIELIINGKINQQNVIDQEIKNFAQKELIAAIDLNSKIKLATQKEDFKTIEQAKLDHLILTEETLTWFIKSPNSFSNLDICLLKNNLSLYLKNYPETLNAEDKDKFKKTLNSTISDLSEIALCSFAQYYNQNSFNNNELLNKINNNQEIMQNNLPGYTYRSQILKDTYGEIFPIKINALLAGLLSL